MPDPFAKHVASLKAHQNYLGSACPSITWNGSNYPVLPGSAMLRKDLGPGGFKLDSDLEFIISRNDFPPTGGPTLKQTITYLNQAYRVDSIETMVGGGLLRFKCNDPNQTA